MRTQSSYRSVLFRQPLATEYTRKHRLSEKAGHHNAAAAAATPASEAGKSGAHSGQRHERIAGDKVLLN